MVYPISKQGGVRSDLQNRDIPNELFLGNLNEMVESLNVFSLLESDFYRSV
jgi:hypothetical protein